MTRPLTAVAVVLAGVAAGHAQQAVQIQVQQGGVIWVNDGSQPATPAAPPKEFKPAANADPDPKSLAVADDLLAKGHALVRQLGNPLYREREAASREIAKMGRTAYGPLRAALETDRNPEVRLRVELLLPRVEAEEMEARVGCFLKDADGRFDHDLPGWKKFRAAAGTDAGTRTLFADVLKNRKYHALLIAADLPANDLGVLLNSHFRELQAASDLNQNFRGRGGVGTQPSTAELAVLTFLEGLHTDKELGLNYAYGYTVGSYLHTQDAVNAAQHGTGKYGAPLKRLLARWLDTRETASGAQMAMNFAQNWNLPTRTKYAAKVLAAPAAGNDGGWMRVNALMVIGQANAKEYVPHVAKCLDDATVIQQGDNRGGASPTIQLQDYALGVAIQLTGQKPADYGLATASTGVNWAQHNFFFRDDKDPKGVKADDKRKAALKKWAAWDEAKKDPKDEPKKDGEKKDEPKKDGEQPKM